MLKNLTKDKVHHIIDLAKAVDRDALLEFVSALSQDEHAELMALMWKGRGDDPQDSWEVSVQYAKDHSDDGDVNYIIGKTPLPDYLTKGLEALEG